MLLFSLGTTKTAPGAHTALVVPWQARLTWLQEPPLAHSAAARGSVEASWDPPPARAASQLPHPGAAAIPRASAPPRKK